jgi:hypothetical protein
MAVVQEELVLQEAQVLLRPLPAATCLPLLYACV